MDLTRVVAMGGDGGTGTPEMPALMQAAVEQASDAIMITTALLDPPGPRIVYVNPAFTRMTGYEASEVLGRTPRLLQGPRTDRAVLDRLKAACARGEQFQGRLLNYRKDGSDFLQESQIAPIRDASGTITHFVGIQQDITALVHLEAQLRQAQKMEAIGRLAGGVAHDFNNLLTVIGASASFLRERHAADSEDAADAEEIEAAVRRASTLTAQLLAFSRQQVRQPQVLDLALLVADVQRMLGRVIGEDVRLVTEVDGRPLPVVADPGQLEQVLLNLAVNARDAMPDGGTLTLIARAVPRASLPPAGAHAGASQGAHEVALLGVADTGCGMDEPTVERAFEPFFTTKERGRGTGLGLATVHGIAAQSGGAAWIDSAPGRGTRVWVALPLAARRDVAPAAPGGTARPARGSGRVLLVEDDDAVRALTRRVLVAGGYEVVEARNGHAALQRWGESGGRGIDVVVTDMVMPGLAGHDLLRRLRAERPDLPALLLSGYAPDARVESALAAAAGITVFLEKPYRADALLEHVARVLASAATRR